MRLSEEQRKIICEEATAIFGSGVSARLFGSRLDDSARGGDIDIYIEAEGTPKELLDKELKLGARLERRLGERRIDVVVRERHKPLREIDRHARETGVPL